jgi:hypothetical protein
MLLHGNATAEVIDYAHPARQGQLGVPVGAPPRRKRAPRRAGLKSRRFSTGLMSHEVMPRAQV